jgi:hypothetical protein
LDEYPYSGHREYCGARASEVLEPSRVLEMLGGRAACRRFVQDGLKDGHREDYYDVIDERFLGDEHFAEKLKVKSRRRSRDAAAQENSESATFRTAARAVGAEPAVLSGADPGWEVSRCRASVGYELIRRLG